MPENHEPVDVLPVSEISPRNQKAIHRQGLLVPMRDGVQLALDLIRPERPGAYPVVLVRTPYDKTANRRPFYWELAERGYVVAVQDCRGRFNSDGEFFPYRNEHKDGYDTVEWIAAQPWCDGNVGMAGVSYVGQTQWFAAVGSAAAPESDHPGELAARRIQQRAGAERLLSAPDQRVDAQDGPALVGHSATVRIVRGDAGLLLRPAAFGRAGARRNRLALVG